MGIHTLRPPSRRVWVLEMRANDRGAAAVTIAAMMVLLIGMAAIAIDVGAGFTERRQDQTSADVGVLAGAIDVLNLGECGAAAGPDDGGCNQLLTFVETNLSNAYSASEWTDIWRQCTDPNKPNGFGPLPASTSNGWTGFVGERWDGTVFNDTVDCISVSQDELRVRVPDQLNENAFGQVLGLDNLTTNAVAQARIIRLPGARPIIPFGVTNGTAGESCVLQPPAGVADPPCDGGTTGNFGAVLAQVWGSPESNGDCSPSSWPPGVDTIAFHTANGMDHPIGIVTDTGALPPTVNTFSSDVATAGGQNLAPLVDAATVNDRCTESGGENVAWDATVGQTVVNGENIDTGAVNTLFIDTGASADAQALTGFITGIAADFPESTLPGFQARLRFGDCTILPTPAGSICLDLGASQGSHQVDNIPLWNHLLPGVNLNTYNEAITGFSCGAGPVTNSVEMDCVLGSPDLTSVIFSSSMLNTRRFAWVPEFHYSSWGSGVHWQPVVKYSVGYISNFWFQPTGPGGIVKWEAGSNPGTIPINMNGLEAVSAMVIPDTALPLDVLNSCPSCVNAEFETELTR